MASSAFNTAGGGGANYLCMPEEPKYLSYGAGVQGNSIIVGTEYKASGVPLAHVNDHNAPCAVCLATTRSTQIMMPGTYECPSAWKREYYGYLMTAATLWGDQQTKTYICVDKDPESIPGSGANTSPALLYHVEAGCNGLPCPPYSAEKELTCAVCSY